MEVQIIMEGKMKVAVMEGIGKMGFTERPIPTPDGFDSTFYPLGMESVPRKIAIVRANHYVVDHVDFLIAYAWHPASNGTGAGGVRKKSTKKSFPFHNNVKMSRLDKN